MDFDVRIVKLLASDSASRAWEATGSVKKDKNYFVIDCISCEHRISMDK